jgi:hypothetical protein
MSIARKSVLALAAVLASGTVALAAQYDGDNNLVPGTKQQVSSPFGGAFASATRRVTLPRAGTRTMVLMIEIDGDGNMILEQR